MQACQAFIQPLLATTWQNACPDTYGFPHGVPTEGAGLNATWTTLGAFNRSYPYLLIRDHSCRYGTTPAYFARAPTGHLIIAFAGLIFPIPDTQPFPQYNGHPD